MVKKKYVELKGYVMYSTIYENEVGFNGIPQDIIFLKSYNFDLKLSQKQNLLVELANNPIEAYEIYFQSLRHGISDLRNKLNQIETITIVPSKDYEVWKSFKVFYGSLIFDETYMSLLKDEHNKSHFKETIEFNIDGKFYTFSYIDLPNIGIISGFSSLNKDGKKIIGDFGKMFEWSSDNN